MATENLKKEPLDFPNFVKILSRLEDAFDYKIPDSRTLQYHKTLSDWGITDETLPRVITEILKKCHRFPSLAAFWEARGESCAANGYGTGKAIL